MIRILGIDPGLRQTGWGVVEAQGSALRGVASGTIKVAADGQDLPQRLAELEEALHRVLRDFDPDAVAVEETFSNQNANSTLKLGMARGVALLVPARLGLPVRQYAATLVKKSLVGAGRADKNQIQMMVRTLLPNMAPDSADAADALAVAICHAHHREIGKIEQQGVLT